MRTCCVKGCDSSKYITLKYYAFFNFPMDNEDLLKKWLSQINQPDLKPKHHQICSVHFQNEDIIWRPDGLPPSLKPTAVPTIFSPQETNTIASQSCAPTFLVTIPIDASLKSSREINGNGTLPVILIPTQYLFPYQPSFPPQLSSQLLPQNQLQSQQFIQINPQNTLLTQSVPQIIPQSSQQTQPVVQIKPQNPLQTEPVLQIDLQNSLSTQFPRIDPKCPEQSVQYLQQLSAINPALSAQLAQQMTAQNPAIIAQFPQIRVQIPENGSQISEVEKTQNPMEISPDSNALQNSHSNGQNSVRNSDSPESLKINGQLKNTNLRSYSRKQVRNHQVSPPNDQKYAMTSQYSEMEENSKNSISKTLEITKNLQSTILHPLNSTIEIEEQKPNICFADKSSILQPISGKILPTATFPLKTEFNEEKILVKRVTKPDYLLISKNKNFGNTKNMERTKTPILRISIKKLSNVPPESKNFSEKENSSEDKKLSEKSITIENHRTKKSVTFRLDSRTGEIVVEHIISTQERRTRNTGKKRKVDTSVRSSAVNLGQLCAKEQRECGVFRRKLKLLRLSHKRELEEIQKLQTLLSELEAVKKSNCSVKVQTRLRLENDRSKKENSKTVQNFKKLLPQEGKPQHDKNNVKQKTSNLPLVTTKDLVENSGFSIPKTNSKKKNCR